MKFYFIRLFKDMANLHHHEKSNRMRSTVQHIRSMQYR